MWLSFLFTVGAVGGWLDGNWRQDCLDSYQREELFSGASVAFTEKNFWDHACLEPSVETISRGTFFLGGATLRPAGSSEIDFIFESVSLKPMSERTVEAWRGRALCGIREWEMGREHDITGRDCDFLGLGSVVKVPSKGDRKFGVILSKGNFIYLGQLTSERDGSSPLRRPFELDPHPYQRVH